ncbi:MAG: DUF4922 domain-containing protein [Muribaculaceae bacterium]|nr:DUF4922 domain-containing protein [Muribaculaceae bacterium]
MNRKEIKEFFYNQLKSWPLAAKNYRDLEKVKKRPFKTYDLEGYFQFNKGRSVSSLAKLDPESVKKRPCFLCSHNRPDPQSGIKILPGWELHVNPFPILNEHFTIIKDTHIPQELDIDTGKVLANIMEEYIVFFNGDGAGASAPDHLHFQAVPFGTLPLVNLLDSNWEKREYLNLPFKILTDENEIRNLNVPVNAFFWRNEDNEIRMLAIPRTKHRPERYFMQPPLRRAISPGAIDMTGVIVVPIEEDFNIITEEEIKDIYQEVGCNE